MYKRTATKFQLLALLSTGNIPFHQSSVQLLVEKSGTTNFFGTIIALNLLLETGLVAAEVVVPEH